MQQAIAIVDAYAYGALISAMRDSARRGADGRRHDRRGGDRGGTADGAGLARARSTPCATSMQWLAGDRLSLADLHLAPIMAYFSGTPEGQRLLPEHPKLTSWWAAMSSRPSMAKTQPQLG